MLRAMDQLRAGHFVRAERRRRGLRQADIAAKARVAQSTVSRLEKGAMDALTMGTVKRICQALEIRVEYVFRTRGPDPDRLLDARHAEIVAAVIRRLGPAWITTSEYSFNDYGDPDP
jgi:transcriptional regulator with XRE-family HTH domain